MADEPSNWRRAEEMQRLELIRLVILLTAEFYRNWGRFPTATEIAAQIRGEAP